MMDQESKKLFGRMLGEIFRCQKRIDENMCPFDDATLYGLIAGIENIIDEFIDKNIKNIFVSEKQFEDTKKILDEICDDKSKLKNFKGFYDIREKLEAQGIDRATARVIFKYFHAKEGYTPILNKMNSKDSPIECKTFELEEYDK